MNLKIRKLNNPKKRRPPARSLRGVKTGLKQHDRFDKLLITKIIVPEISEVFRVIFRKKNKKKVYNIDPYRTGTGRSPSGVEGRFLNL